MLTKFWREYTIFAHVFEYTKAIKTGCDCSKLLRKWPMSFVTEIGGRYLARYHLDRSLTAGGLSIAQSQLVCVPKSQQSRSESRRPKGSHGPIEADLEFDPFWPPYHRFAPCCNNNWQIVLLTCVLLSRTCNNNNWKFLIVFSKKKEKFSSRVNLGHFFSSNDCWQSSSCFDSLSSITAFMASLLNSNKATNECWIDS